MVLSISSVVGRFCGRGKSYHSPYSYRLVLSVLLTLFYLDGPEAVAQTDAQNRSEAKVRRDSASTAATIEETDDERQERVTAERFLEILKKRPRTGTALDKVYGYHVQHGSLDQFSDSLREEAVSKNSGQAWLLLGLVNMQRGQDAEARVALEKAEEHLPKEPLASFYLGKTLILLGDVDAAATALERAVERKPARADMLQVFQELGRLYQRMRRVDDAVSVWNRMEQLFPGDTQVQEQIAIVLAEEGANVEALARYESLVKSTKDRYRQVEMAVRAAQLKESVGRREEALAEFEKVLSQVNPDSWIYQDVRGRIDSMFMTRNDYEGLAKYYTAWMEKHPDDIDAMLRIGRLLSIQRRTPEAKVWFAKAIEKAPSEAAPRLALVEALERDQELAAAADAMKALVEQKPDNPDYIVRWGELVYGNRAVPEAERAPEAAKIWSRLLDKRGNDPVTVTRVADLLRGAQLTEEALASYRKAVALAETEPQYREYLGEFLFRLGRKEEALSVWKELASGSRETRDNLVRLSEVFSTFKLNSEALTAMARACDLQPTFGQRTRYAELLREDSQYEKALQQLALAAKIAESPEDHSLVVDEQIKNYQGSGQLEQRIADLEREIAEADKDNAAAWARLALFQEADHKYQQAALSIAQAAELEPQSISIHTIAVRVQDRAGSFGEAIASLRKLASLERRYLSNHLMQIASLQMRLGQLDEALVTGQELISVSGAGAEQFRFFADLCFQAGRNEQGLDALRRNVRSNPSDREAVRLLARTLAGQFKTEESIELYWRAFGLSPNIDEKRMDVEALTELYLRTNRFDQLVARLETGGRENNRQREAALLMAAANQAAGDLGAARAILEPLLREGNRDTALLSMVIKLAQTESDWEAAVEYQKRLNEVTPTPEGDYQLAKFLFELGETEQAEAIWLQLSSKFATAENLQQTVERLLLGGETERALTLVEQAIKREPENWEILPVAISTFWRADDRDRALETAEQLLKLQIPSDTRSAAGKQSAATPATRSWNATSASPTPSLNATTRAAWLSRLSQNMIRFRTNSMSVGISGIGGFSSAQSFPPLQILTFADARAFAVAIKSNIRPKEFQTPQQVAAWLEEQLASSDREQLWLALATLQTTSGSAGSAARMAALNTGFTLPVGSTVNANTASASSPYARLLERLLELGDKEAVTLLISSRHNERMAQSRNVSTTVNRVPLGEAELTSLSNLYQQYQAFQTSISAPQSPIYALWLAEEFKLADRQEQSQQYVDEAFDLASATPNSSFTTNLLAWDRSRATRIFLQNSAKNLQSPRGPINPAPSNSLYQTAGFVAMLLKDSQNSSQDIEHLIAELKLQQAARAKQLRPSQLAEYDPTQIVDLRTVVANANQMVLVPIDFPAVSALQSSNLLVALRLVHLCENEKIKQAVGKRLETEADEADQDVMLSAIDRLCFATWLWWSDSKHEALQQMEKFAELGVAKELATLLQSRMLYELGRTDDALALLESYKPLNQQMLQDKELAVLQLVLQKGDSERAKQSAERLFALRLPSSTQLQVAGLMNQIGMREMADSLTQRARRRGGNDLSTQVEVMQKHAAQKNEAGASEIARQILRRTSPNADLTIRSANASHRQSALRVLVNTGEAKTMIESLEQRLTRSPNSVSVILALAELYEASGKRTEAQAALAKLSKKESQDPRAMLAAARALSQAGKHAEAVDKYLAVFDKQPELFQSSYPMFRTSVQQGKQWKRVAEKLQQTNLNKFGNNFPIGDFVSQLATNGEPQLARKLLMATVREKGLSGLSDISAFVLVPNQRTSSSNLIDDELRQLAFDQFVLAIDSQVDPTQLFRQLSLTTNGRMMTLLASLDRLFTGDAARISKLIEKVEPMANKQPHWIVVHAALHVINKDYPHASDVAKPLMQLPESSKAEVTNAVWALASLLAHEHSQVERAIEVFEPWLTQIESRQPQSIQSFDVTMNALALYCYKKANQVAKAKALLDTQLSSAASNLSTSTSIPGYAEYRLVEFQLNAAQQYLDIAAPLETLKVIVSLASNPSLRERASQIGMQSTDQRIVTLRQRALAAIDLSSFERMMTELVTGPSNDSLESIRSYPAFVMAPEFDELKESNAQISCLLSLVLQDRCKNAAVRESAEIVYKKIVALPEAERSTLGLIALICFADALDEPDQVVKLAKTLKERMEAEVEDGTDGKPNAADSKPDSLAKALAALFNDERAALWLVVHCLNRRGEKDLALHFLKNARYTDGSGDTKNLAQLSRRLAQIRLRLELGQTDSLGTELRAIIEAPLTATLTTQSRLMTSSQVSLAQFGRPGAVDNNFENRKLLVLEASALAARAGLFDLSFEGARKLTEKFTTINRPVFESPLLSGKSGVQFGAQASAQRAIMVAQANPTGLSQEPAVGVAFQQKLKMLADVWKETKAPVEITSSQLQNIVLPPGSPGGIRMFADTMTRRTASNFDFSTKPPALPWSLGFELVEWSQAAGQLEALQTVLESRASQVSIQPSVIALLVYADRVAGRSDVCAKRLETYLTGQPKLNGQSDLLLSALKRPLPYTDSRGAIEPHLVEDFVVRIAQLDLTGDLAKGLLLELLSMAIERDDRAQVNRFILAFDAAIDQQFLVLPQNAQVTLQSSARQKTMFHASVERECRRLGKTDLAVDIAIQGALNSGLLSQVPGSLEDRLVEFSGGSSEQRFTRARRLLLDSPPESMAQFGFVTQGRISLPPVFFNARDIREEQHLRLKPFKQSRVLSLLDLLLNEAESHGQDSEVVNALFEKAGARDDTVKLLAQWLMLRADKRGQTLDGKIVQLGTFAKEEDFVKWLERIPTAAANEIIAGRLRRLTISGPLLEIIERPHSIALVRQFSGADGLVESFHKQRNPSGPPLRSISALKHWCIADPSQSQVEDEEPRMMWTVPNANGNQSLRYRTGALMLRYPISGDALIKATVGISPLQSTSMGLNGLSIVLSPPEQTRSGYISWTKTLDERYGSASIQLPLSESNAIEWTLKGDTISIAVQQRTQRSWRHSATAFPFVSLHSNYWNSTVPVDYAISGEIHIPREVKLIDAALTGWSCSLFRHPLPPAHSAFEEIGAATGNNRQPARYAANEFLLPTWHNRNGELVVGRSPETVLGQSLSVTRPGSPKVESEDPTLKRQTLLSYNRPLLEGERIEFELFYDTKAQTVAPAIGRIAYCLDRGEKVSLHWVATASELRRLNLLEDNRAEDPSGEQLAPLQLKGNDWNRLSISLRDGIVLLSLEGKEIYRRPLGKDESNLFGFFADPTAPEARIRNVVLKGDWPERLPKDLWELGE